MPRRYATEPHPLLTPASLDSHVSFEACGDHFRYRVTVAGRPGPARTAYPRSLPWRALVQLDTLLGMAPRNAAERAELELFERELHEDLINAERENARLFACT